jgi:carbon-monoxide dehydrogenase medium subunit
MYIPDFRYHRPGTLEEVCRILETREGALLLAGGTDLLVDLKQGKRRPADVVSLSGIPELRSVHLEDGRLSIGATATHAQLAASPLVEEHCPAICEAARTIATEQIRNTATVGGNLCTAASCSDTAPVLIALEAEVELVGGAESRTLPLRDFFVFHKETALRETEVLARILVPLPQPGTGAAYRKFGLREAAAVAVASVAARVRIEQGICADASVVLGAVAPTPWIAGGAVKLLVGKSLGELEAGGEHLAAVGRAAMEESEPIDDLRGSAEFRRQLVGTLTERAVAVALERATDGWKGAPGSEGDRL